MSAENLERQMPDAVIWHEVECGSYNADLALWLALADQHEDPILEVGAGTGRVTLELARAGHRVIALDRDPELLTELGRRARGLPVQTALGDARELERPERFGLIAVPMQTVQLFGGTQPRTRFLERAARHLAPGGVVALAISERVEPFHPGDGQPSPLPDIRERDGVIYCSHPTAVRDEAGRYVLERRRERTDADGRYVASKDVVRLDRVTAAELEAEGALGGLTPARRHVVAPTADHVGSVVVLLGA